MGSFLETVLVGLPVIGILIFIHELGHFLVAKWCGVGVLKFAIGFGPTILRYRRGETDYQIGAFPLGGYVRMMGDTPDLITGEKETEEDIQALEAKSHDRSRWFLEKGYFARSAIVVAGPLFNFVSAVFFIMLAVLIYGKVVPKTTAEIGGVLPSSPAESAGLQEGDRVVTVNAVSVGTFEELSKSIRSSGGEPIPFEIEGSDGQRRSVVVRPERISKDNPDQYQIGIYPAASREPATLVGAAETGVRLVGYWTAETYKGIWGMVTGHISSKELAGPIMIFSTARTEAKKGFEPILRFMAILSVSLAVLNLLPIPLLDGGHLLIFTVEAVFGPLSVRKKEVAQNIGLVFLLSLMVFAFANDFGRLFQDKPGPVSEGKEKP